MTLLFVQKYIRKAGWEGQQECKQTKSEKSWKKVLTKVEKSSKINKSPDESDTSRKEIEKKFFKKLFKKAWQTKKDVI